MPLATDRKPDKAILETSREVTRTIGMQADPIQNSQTRTLCRGAGMEFQTPRKPKIDDQQWLLASAKSSSSKTVDDAAWLLRSARSSTRSCRTSTSKKTKISDEDGAKWLLKTPGT